MSPPRRIFPGSLRLALHRIEALHRFGAVVGAPENVIAPCSEPGDLLRVESFAPLYARLRAIENVGGHKEQADLRVRRCAGGNSD